MSHCALQLTLIGGAIGFLVGLTVGIRVGGGAMGDSVVRHASNVFHGMEPLKLPAS